MTEPARVAVVIPAYLAAATVAGVVARVKAALPDADVVVVDDGSNDGTSERARAAGARVLGHKKNLGKGRALATGLLEAGRSGAEVVVTLDADGQHPPEHIPALLGALGRADADLVVGARRRDPAAMPAHRRFTNWLSSALASRAAGATVPDSQSGFRAMTRRVAQTVQPKGNGYEFETEFIIEAAARGFRLAAVEVPTLYPGTPSHFRLGADTLAIAGVLLRHWRAIITGKRPT